MLVINSQISIPLREIKFKFSRSSGPGGQNVNKLNTKVQLRWNLEKSAQLPDDVRQRMIARYKRRMTGAGELVISSQRFRDQGQNVADCLNKLKEMVLSVATPPKKRKPRSVSKAAKQRRFTNKRRRSETKRLRRSPKRENL